MSWKKANTTPPSGAGAATRKRPAPKNAFLATATSSVSGTRKNQRPELWNLFNGRKQYGEHFRIFPISNWTELDVWQYLAVEQVELPSLYFAHEREVLHRDGMLLATEGDLIPLRPEEKVEKLMVRCRTIGDITTTGVWRSEAKNLEDIIAEVSVARQTERGGRADDKRSETAMEDRKKQGYF